MWNFVWQRNLCKFYKFPKFEFDFPAGICVYFSARNMHSSCLVDILVWAGLIHWPNPLTSRQLLLTLFHPLLLLFLLPSLPAPSSSRSLDLLLSLLGMQSANICLHAQVFISRYLKLYEAAQSAAQSAVDSDAWPSRKRSETSNQNNKIGKASHTAHVAILFCLFVWLPLQLTVVATAT